MISVVLAYHDHFNSRAGSGLSSNSWIPALTVVSVRFLGVGNSTCFTLVVIAEG